MAEFDDTMPPKVRKPPIPYTAEEVNALCEPGGYKKAFKLIRRNQIKLPGGMETLEEMKHVLLNHLNKQGWQNQVPATIASQLFDKKRTHILRIYDQLHKLCQLPEWGEKQREEMDLRVKDWYQNLTGFRNELDRGKCSILVAGETGAGKSSFINLLLEEDIMPVDDALSTTSCICEIHHSKRKWVRAFRCDGSTDEKQLEDMTSDEIKAVLRQYAHETRNRKSGLEYERLELYWPLPFLSDGIVLVDSPGLGESTYMDERTMHYVHKAVAFVYVLNSEAAGGFTEGRLDKLLTIYTQQKDKSKLIKFDSRSALFVFNKWDKIKDEVRAKIKDRVLNKIRLKWPLLNEDQQVHYLSVKMARNFFHEGMAMPPEYKNFSDVFHLFLRTGLDLTIHHHVTWLDGVMNDMMTCVRTPLTNAKREDRDNLERMARLDECLQRLRQDTNQIIFRLQQNKESKLAEIATHLHEYLKTPQAFERMKTGMLNEELPVELDMEVNKALSQDLIRKVLLAEISSWEDEHHMILDAVQELKTNLVAEFSAISSEIQKVEEDMRGGGGYSLSPLRQLPGDVKDKLGCSVFTETERTVITFTSPLWLPLALVATAIVTPIVGSYSLISQLVQKHKLAKFERAREEKIVKWLSNTIKGMTPETIADEILRELMKDVDDYIMAFRLSLPDIILSNKRLIKDTKDKTVPSSVILKTYGPLWLSLKHAMGIRNLYYYEYDLVEEEKVYRDKDVLGEMTKIAKGTFADVYKTEFLPEIQFDGLAFSASVKRYPIAVKRYRAYVDETNVTDLIIERDVLKKSAHENVIRIYATICCKDGLGRLSMMLVLELCEKTLKEAIYNGLMPGKQPDAKKEFKNTVYVLGKLLEVCDGLAYLHGNRIVHRDLKLENILLKGGQVKLADLGHNKAEDLTPGTEQRPLSTEIVGTLQYTDPTILKKRYVHYEADIYSLALVMWEMWYGEDIYPEWNYELAERVVEGHRRGFVVEGAKAPFQDYRDLVEWCWEGEPHKRPPAETVKTIVRDMKQAIVKWGPEVDYAVLSFTSEYQATLVQVDVMDGRYAKPLPLPAEPLEAQAGQPILPGRGELPRRYHSASDSTHQAHGNANPRMFNTWTPGSTDHAVPINFTATLPMTSSFSSTTWYVALPPEKEDSDSELVEKNRSLLAGLFKPRRTQPTKKSK